MPISRRSLLKAAATVPALSLPGIVRAESQSTLRFIPVIDLAFVDPIYSTAQVSRNHGFMVYDTLYGMSSSLQVSPQMCRGPCHLRGRRQALDLSLRDGLNSGTMASRCWRATASPASAAGRRATRLGGELMAATDELSAADDRTIRLPPQASLPAAAGGAGQGRDRSAAS